MNEKSKYFIFTLGCQMNVNDSQRIATKLEKLGCQSAPEKEADLVIVNACSVRQKAVDRIWGKIKIWKEKNKKVLITGCVLPQDKKKFGQKGVKYTDFRNDKFFDILPKVTGNIAYVPIMTGCDNFCSYCAVPYTRGHEISRPVEDVIRDVKLAIKTGSKDILLLGQNVNSYQYGFDKLLKNIDALPGDFRFNFITSNPHDMTDEMIKTFSGLKKWPCELHLPLQSGDDKILRKMNRRYNGKRYLDLVSVLKSQISNLLLSTDIIVGFPGETNEQFNNTVSLCKKIGFAKAYIAQYSPRPGTVATKLKDNIPREEKKRRRLILDQLINQ